MMDITIHQEYDGLVDYMEITWDYTRVYTHTISTITLELCKSLDYVRNSIIWAPNLIDVFKLYAII